jgi:hypothetical protein
MSPNAWVLMVLAVASFAASTGQGRQEEAGDLNSIRQLWKLPLGILSPSGQFSIVAEPDESALYVADSRGVLFAVEAATGAVRWSNPGFDAISALYSFKDIPGILYALTTNQTLQQATLYALDKHDGLLLNSVQNLTGSLDTFPAAAIGRIAPTAKGNKLAILHESGIQVMDPTLSTVYWAVANNDTYLHPVGLWFNHLVANDDTIMTIGHNGDHIRSAALAFDTETGKLLCQIDNSSAAVDALIGIPFALDARGNAIVDLEVSSSPGSATLLTRVADFRQCMLRRTDRVNDWALEGGSVFLPPPYRKTPAAAEDALFFGLSRKLLNITTWGDWVVTHSRLGSDATLWNFTLPTPPLNADFGLGQPPVVGRVPGHSDRIHIWSRGFLTEVNVSSGKATFSVNSVQVPAGPPFSPGWISPFAFPLGDPNTSGRVLVPNLLGYTVVDAITQSVLEYHLDPRDPVVATFGFQGVVSGAGISSFVVSVTTDGALVAYA